jgi:hypothetical protein
VGARPENNAGIEGLAADRASGNGRAAAARHVEGRRTSAASSASRFAEWIASPGSPGLILAPLAPE